MRRLNLARYFLILALALVPMRMAMAHLHLCLDGQEAPVSVHVQEAATHHDVDAVADSGHTDLDLDLSDSVPGKRLASANDVSPAILDPYLFVLLLVAPAPSHVALIVDRTVPAVASAFELRPQPRGPPA